MKDRLFCLQHSIRTRAWMITYPLILRLGWRIPRKLRIMYVVRMLGRAEQNYIPKPYPEKLTLFYGRDPHHSLPNMGWTGLASRIENHVIGDVEVTSRRGIMVEPLVRELAAELTVCLDKAAHECRVRSQNESATGRQSDASDLRVTCRE